MQAMTVEVLREVLPKNLRGVATQEFADKINSIVSDPMVAEEVRNNFLTYSKVLNEGKFKTEDYLNAVVYATHKAMGYTNKDAYARTFPDRYSALIAKGADEKTISAYVAMYHKNKLVNLILEQAAIPMWLLNQDVYQKAINTQLGIMSDPDVSPKVRAEAANSILTHLKPPEVKKFEIDVGVKNEGGIEDLKATMRELAQTQLQAIERGMGVKDLAARKLTAIDAETVNDDDDR